MPQTTFSPAMHKLADQLESFEASKSVANTGTGARREGEHFEKLTVALWATFADEAASHGIKVSPLVPTSGKNYVLLENRERTLVIPAFLSAPGQGVAHPATRWLDIVFEVGDLIRAFPGESAAIDKYAPSRGEFAGPAYPEMFSGLRTEFDDTVLLVEGGILKEKILLEYKTAKSSKGRQLDGNAHERLSFQIMQYLEIATKYTKCTMVVISNGAFARYRNKYHVNFHVQADRLSNFSWFEMDHASEARDYLRFLGRLFDWIGYLD